MVTKYGKIGYPGDKIVKKNYGIKELIDGRRFNGANPLPLSSTLVAKSQTPMKVDVIYGWPRRGIVG